MLDAINPMSDARSLKSDDMCCMSDVRCWMSDVSCQMSDVRSKMSGVLSPLLDVDILGQMQYVICHMSDVRCHMSFSLLYCFSANRETLADFLSIVCTVKWSVVTKLGKHNGCVREKLLCSERKKATK